MDDYKWYSVIHEEDGVKPDTLVEATGHLETDLDNSDLRRARVRYPVGGVFCYAWIATTNLLGELPPDNWLTDTCTS